jgi:hypothetical protein
MKALRLVLVLAAVVSVMAFGFGPIGARAGVPKILEFDSMVGVPRPYTGAANAIRGVNGGGLPWVIGSATGELKQSGKLELSVTGLVFDPNDQAVKDRNLAGINNQPKFNALVSCLSRDASGNPLTVNLTTGPFAATTGPAGSGGGNAKVEAQLALPKPCIAPIVFVTNEAASAWFAATGQ